LADIRAHRTLVVEVPARSFVPSRLAIFVVPDRPPVDVVEVTRPSQTRPVLREHALSLDVAWQIVQADRAPIDVGEITRLPDLGPHAAHELRFRVRKRAVVRVRLRETEGGEH